ncbi:MAG: S-methyl-5-thioribose-1-phosphate isomerase [Candidatus Cloacimonetes bacterium]|nr:S-methyl-5-thioribose-1-phosphate isomerase [Candidatus Cloacimonadota bacterium]
MRYQDKDYQTVWLENGRLFIIDQNQLPFEFTIIELHDIEQVYEAIKIMKVRGAPAIGAVAALGYALAIGKGEDIHRSYQLLLSSRPTAIDLQNGLDFVKQAIARQITGAGIKAAAIGAAQQFTDNIANECLLIGKYGNELIADNCRILTHCNAGALATVDYGTALAPMREAHYAGKNIFVYVDETRPRLQGMRLTAWELAQEGIDHAIIADNAAGYYMQQGKIDLVITGADRIARNGDIANKIGTYSKAVLAKENNIPFYIAAPFSTFYRQLLSGRDIPIEERPAEEVLTFNGVALSSGLSGALNPAFDITKAKYISGYITPAGIFNKKDFDKLWEMNIKVQNSGQI